MLKLGFTYKKSQTNWNLLTEATSSSAESNIYGLRKIRQKPAMFDLASDSDCSSDGNLRDYKLNIYNYEKTVNKQKRGPIVIDTQADT